MAPSFRHAGLLAALLALLACGRIISTYSVFSQTFDEPAHVACGMQWLDHHEYTYETQHPPLARVAVALGPYLGGVRSSGATNMWEEGNALLHSGERYHRNLSLARAGVLPFFLLACALLWWWTRRLFGELAAGLALLLFTFLPPVLGHAGLATTDMAVTAFVFASVWAWCRWLARPSWAGAALLGVAVALAVLSKFTALLFLPPLMAFLPMLYLAAPGAAPPTGPRGLVRRAATLAAAGLLCALCIWAGYRFSIGRMTPGNRPVQAVDRIFGDHTLPAPEFFDGLAECTWHASRGHQSWLLGEYGTGGWWYFFPVALAVKTPLPFLLLAAAGLSALILGLRKRSDWEPWVPVLAPALIVLVCLPSSINLGVRHVLAVYPFLAMLAGYGAAALLRPPRAVLRIAAVGLLVWNGASSTLAHPDYLAYFNELAAGNPEYFLAESDLDWGQDLDRLSRKLQAVGARQVWLAYFGSADISRHGLPPVQPMPAWEPVTGWIAISVHYLTIGSAAIQEESGRETGPLAWLEPYRPVARAGKSILLYYVPPR